MRRMLLLSNSSIPGEDYFNWGKPFLKEFLGEKPIEVLFIPYAGVTISYDEYTATLQKVYNEVGHSVVGIHTFSDPKEAVMNASAIAVGGGNTFRLFEQLHQYDLIEAINKRVEDGVPYMGWSAGTNTTLPFLYTTNDMPITEPASFKGLGQLPFQVNVHYTNASIPGHGGETRDMRLMEFKTLHPQTPLVGLRECSLIEVVGDRYYLKGRGNTMKLFSLDGKHQEIPEGEFDPSSWGAG